MAEYRLAECFAALVRYTPGIKNLVRARNRIPGSAKNANLSINAASEKEYLIVTSAVVFRVTVFVNSQKTGPNTGRTL